MTPSAVSTRTTTETIRVPRPPDGCTEKPAQSGELARWQYTAEHGSLTLALVPRDGAIAVEWWTGPGLVHCQTTRPEDLWGLCGVGAA